MKILIVTQYFRPENFRINDLAQSMKSAGHEVVVLTGIPNYPEGKWKKGYGWTGPYTEKWEQIDILRVPHFPRLKGRGWQLFLNYFSFAFMSTLIGMIRVPRDIDLIFVFEPSPVTVGTPAVVLKWMTGAPIQFWVQDLWSESLASTGAVKSKWVLRLVDRMVQWIYNHSDHVLVQSRAFIEKLSRFNLSDTKIKYLPNTAEPFYRPMSVEVCPKALSHIPEGFWVMFAGNIGVAQDFPMILDCVEKTKDLAGLQWVFVGDGRERSWVESEVKRRGLESRIYLVGSFPAEEMPKFFACADVLLVSLKKDPAFAATIPGKVQSYLACGKPVLAALDGEGAQVIREAGAGRVAPSGDSDALASALRELMNLSSEQLKKISTQSREYFDREFSNEAQLKNIEMWASEIVHSWKK